LLERQEVSAEAVFVEGHADDGVHADFLEGGDFASSGDAAGGDDGQARGAAQLAEPGEIHATHSAFVVHICAEEAGAIGFEGRNDFGGSERERSSPAVDYDAAFGGVQGDQDVFLADAGREAFQERHIGALLAKCGAADDDLLDAEADQRFGAAHGANSAAYAQLQFGFMAGFAAELLHQAIVVAFAHGGIEINDVQPSVMAETIKQTEDIGDGEFALATMREVLSGSSSRKKQLR